jgi:hypothetical protein
MVKLALKVAVFSFGVLWLWGAWINLTDQAFRPDLPPEYAFWERVSAALLAGLGDISQTSRIASDLLSGPASAVRQEFSGEIEAVQEASSGFFEKARATAMFVGLYGWREVLVPVSVVQFCVFFILRGFGASVLWDYPGIPKLENMTAKAVAWIALGVFCYGIAVNAYAAGVWTTIAAAIALPVVLRFPIVGTLPLWTMQKVLRIDPHSLFRLPFQALEHVKSHLEEREKARRAEAESPVPKEPPREPVSPPEPSMRPEPVADPLDDAGPRASYAGATYESACQTFGLTPHTFNQSEVTTKYRELMRGARGSPERAKAINLAYEAVLAAHGWSR